MPEDAPPFSYDKYDTLPPKKPKRAASAEWKLQAACITYVKKRKLIDPLMRHTVRWIANMPEGQRDPNRAAIAKMMGMQRGVADILLFRKTPFVRANTGFRLDWCELKRPGEKLRLEQQEWVDWLGDTPVRCHLITDLDQFIAVLES